MKNENKEKPQNEREVLFIRGLPYYAPRTAKSVAFCLDNGDTKEDILKKLPKNTDKFTLGIFTAETALELLIGFIDFYLTEPERAKELFMPYSVADYNQSYNWNGV